ncbi:hypothetical protein PYCC9005_001815 [Savitreella phatthalungensis]
MSSAPAPNVDDPKGKGDNAFGVTTDSNLQGARLEHAKASLKESWGKLTGNEKLHEEAKQEKDAAREQIKTHGTHEEARQIDLNNTK